MYVFLTVLEQWHLKPLLFFLLILTSTDINECERGLYDCNENAACINTPGSYDCQCNIKFTGDGFNCTGIIIICTVKELSCVLLADRGGLDINTPDRVTWN